jgi:dolichol-phosphate mannosyltransferase
LDVYKGDAVVIMMADNSDEPTDLLKYYRKLQDGYDCVFGTRFARRTKVTDYPQHKLIFNRLGNWFIQLLFWLPYNDVTNAFKCYRRQAIEGIRPLVSCHFNLTVEMPLKSIVRGYTWCVVRTNWYGREKGTSKWKIKELGSRYMFIILYVWLEKMLTMGDYQKGKYWLKEK